LIVATIQFVETERRLSTDGPPLSAKVAQIWCECPPSQIGGVPPKMDGGYGHNPT
jgi:hypothetical protein